MFAQNYHPVQTLPFFFGFAMITGYIMLLAALIFFNYICQTTFVPALSSDYRPEYDPIISTFSLANPRSLSWTIEMWGTRFSVRRPGLPLPFFTAME